MPKPLSKQNYNLVLHNQVLYQPEELKTVVSRMSYDLKRLKRTTEFDSIIGIGHSGSPLVGALSFKLGIPMGIVRKEIEHNKSTSALGAVFNVKYVFIDDLIESQKTFKRVLSVLSKVGSECVAVLLYENWHSLTTIEYNSKRIPIYTMTGKFPGLPVIRTGI